MQRYDESPIIKSLYVVIMCSISVQTRRFSRALDSPAACKGQRRWEVTFRRSGNAGTMKLTQGLLLT